MTCAASGLALFSSFLYMLYDIAESHCYCVINTGCVCLTDIVSSF